MFQLEDNALSQLEIEVLEDIARIEPDGYVNAGAKAATWYNACELLLYWCVDDGYGVQRIKIGSEKQLTRKGWHRRLMHQLYGKRLVEARQVQIRKTFPGEHVSFNVIGYRTLNIQFWNPRTALKFKAAVDATVEQLYTRAARNIPAPMEKKPHG